MDRETINGLMDRASSGDAEAFGAMASMVQDELFRLALAQGLLRDDAVETVQETLLRAYQRLHRWRRGADAAAWLCGIAVNVAREQHRGWRRRGALRIDAAERGAGREAGVDGSSTSGGAQSPHLQHLTEALAMLPPRQREAVACRFLRRMNIRETAVVMRCAEGTVKSAVAAALHKLRVLLEDDT